MKISRKEIQNINKCKTSICSQMEEVNQSITATIHY